jgi:hypothetical protein
MARKVDEAANFVFVQLIEQEPAIYMYDKRHADYARRDKLDLAWEKEFPIGWRSLVCVYTYTYMYNNQNL